MDHTAHCYIADVCADLIPALAPHREALREASVHPDGNGRRHQGLRDLVRQKAHLADKARRAYGRGRTDAAVHHLGTLLHFLADATVGLPLKHPLRDQYEAQVAEALPHVRARLRPPQEVGCRRHLAGMKQVAPRPADVRRGELPPPDEAAERLLDTCVRVAHAIFAPVAHPEDLARLEGMRNWRRNNDAELVGLLRLEHAPVFLPFMNVLGVLWAALVWVGLRLRRGSWHRAPWAFNLPDLGYLGFYACCGVWIDTLLRLGPHTGSAIFWQTLLGSVVTYGLWGIIVSTLAVSREMRGFWTSCFALMGPLSPLMIMFVALSMRFVEIEKPAGRGERQRSSRHKAAS